jgi:hypothetical protein
MCVLSLVVFPHVMFLTMFMHEDIRKLMFGSEMVCMSKHHGVLGSWWIPYSRFLYPLSNFRGWDGRAGCMHHQLDLQHLHYYEFRRGSGLSRATIFIFKNPKHCILPVFCVCYVETENRFDNGE